jgi:hypothetical protein
MRVVVIDGNPKKSGALAELTRAAIDGAEDSGAEVDVVRLAEKDIGYCRFCLKCHQDLDSEVAACVQKDDMGSVIEMVRDADGLIMACPASGGHANAMMKTFIERTTWTLGRPTRRVLWVNGCPESRITDRQRYAVILTTAGVVPTWSRAVCNGSTREMASHAKGLFNATVIDRVYAGSVFKRGLAVRFRERAREAGRSLAASSRRQ